MKFSPIGWAALAVVATSFGCGRAAPSAPAEVVVARARAALAPFKSTLRDALGGALRTSPEAAIDVCALRAPELARAASRDGVTVGRSALKLRSPDNAPRAWLGPVMDRLAKATSGSDAHEVVTLPDGRRGYAEAIWVGAPCLACHGETLAPSVADKLRARYPADAAQGFRAGDFRGVFWAELDGAALARSDGGP
jgi:hypothetical protein